MKTYTADTSALLVDLVDALPSEADRLFQRAEAKEVTLKLPTVAGESAVSDQQGRDGARDRSGDPAEFVEALDTTLPVTVVDDDRLLESIPALIEACPSQIHDAMIVASHQRRETKAIVTSDGEMTEQVTTVWDCPVFDARLSAAASSWTSPNCSEYR